MRRLLPALFITIFVCWIGSFIIFSTPDFLSFNGSILSTVFAISNFYFLLDTDYFHGFATIRPLLHSWSLGVEMQIYFFWPIIFLLLMKYTNKSTLIVTTLIIGLTSLIGNIYVINTALFPPFAPNEETFAFYFTPLRVFEFLIGSSLVWIMSKEPKVKFMSELFFWLGILLITYSIYFFNGNTQFPSYNALIPCVGSTLIIFSSKATIGNYIGKISYSLYLCHWPIIVFYYYYQSNYLNILSDNVLLIDR